VASLAAALALGLVIHWYYWYLASFELFECLSFVSGPPGPQHVEGGQDASVWAAALLGVGAWLGAWKITTGTRLRRLPPLVIPVFAALYLIALLALWYLAPVVWGPEHCVPD
jgi:hypothetical protein